MKLSTIMFIKTNLGKLILPPNPNQNSMIFVQAHFDPTENEERFCVGFFCPCSVYIGLLPPDPNVLIPFLSELIRTRSHDPDL